MNSNEISLLKRALERQKKARQQAEQILEQKSNELYDVTQHLKETNNRLENLLNEKTSELDAAFINIIDPYIVMDLQFDVINMNASAKEFLGYDHTKNSFNLVSLIHEDYLQYTRESIASLLEVGFLKNYRSKIITKNNGDKWVQMNGSLVYDEGRKPIAAQGILRDITQEIEIKELLSEQKKQLDIIVENSPLSIVLCVDGKIVKSNDAFSKLLGYSFDELRQHSLNSISEPEDPSISQELTKRMNEGDLEKFSIVKKYFKKNGSSILGKTLVSAVRDNFGKIEFEVALIEDITKEREAEERIIREREKYSSIIANMNLGLLEVDNDDIIQFANRSFCNMSGYQEDELLGKIASTLLTEKSKGLIKIASEKRHKGSSDSYEVEMIDKSGNKKYWLISGAPRYDSDKNVIGSVGIHLDITNQKLLENQKERLLKKLEDSNHGLQEYAHIVSHDLKSPLRSISALATWIQEDYSDVIDENGNHNFQLMQEKLGSMDKLIHGILEYSTSNNSELDNTEVDLNLVVAEVNESIFIPDYVKLSVPSKLPVIFADSIKMLQLFQNIIGNAVVHIERKNGLVEVLFEETPSYWVFTVKDNGVGIPKEYHKKIFEVFQSLGKNERSTGIGLSIVKKIVNRYEGDVWIDSEVGKGTDFHFSLSKEYCSLKMI
jgi:PAS domain S-box-containing protein